MTPRHSALPLRWLMTDERQGAALWHALARLPRGSGIVFRHYGLPAAERRALYDRVRRVARRRRLLLVLAGGPSLARAWGADGAHGRSPHLTPTLLRTAPAHDRPELRAAARAGASLAFVSPVHPTRSHDGAAALGRVRFGLLVRASPVPVVALGGMTARRGKALAGMGAARWAAIDAWTQPGNDHPRRTARYGSSSDASP